MVPKSIVERTSAQDEQASPSPDVAVLRLLRSEDALAFQGLKRKMHVHQETLSRALQRLEAQGLVTRTSAGYSLTPRGHELANRWPSERSAQGTPVLQSYLPGDLAPGSVADRLRGRWFGNLRWLGQKEEPGRIALRWVTLRSEIEITLFIRWGQMTVEANAGDQEGMAEAFDAAQQIYAQLSGLTSPRGSWQT